MMRRKRAVENIASVVERMFGQTCLAPNRASALLYATCSVCIGRTYLRFTQQCFDTLQDLNLSDKVKATSFDTTASNTVKNKGASEFLEEKVGRPLVHPASRHNILESVLAIIFGVCFGQTKGPNKK